MDEDLGSLNVLEELESKTCALCSAFNDAGNICHYKACIVQVHDTQIRVYSGEMISCDLRS